MLMIPTIGDMRKRMVAEEVKFQKAKNKMLMQLADDARSYTVNWSVVIDDIAAEGYSKTEISMALGMSYTWASSIVLKGIKKIDYPVGMALKQMHKKVCPELHKERFEELS
jgi:hypothetical protein